MTENTYALYRGKCKEMSEAASAERPDLVVTRGWYHCPFWGKQQHWWCVAPDGTIVDPSVRQFPTAGAGADYEPYLGVVECEECGKSGIEEKDAVINGNYAFCSNRCACRFVGL